MALFEGGKAKIEMSREVKAEAERALALNPKDDRAMHVLGRWNREIARLNVFEKTAAKVAFGGVPEGASMNDAVTWLEKAVAAGSRLREPSPGARPHVSCARPQGQGARAARGRDQVPAEERVRRRIPERRANPPQEDPLTWRSG
jgi:hypothetical protein